MFFSVQSSVGHAQTSFIKQMLGYSYDWCSEPFDTMKKSHVKSIYPFVKILSWSSLFLIKKKKLSL